MFPVSILLGGESAYLARLKLNISSHGSSLPLNPRFILFWCILVFLGPRQCHSGCKDLFIESVFFQCHSRVRTNILFCKGQFEKIIIFQLLIKRTNVNFLFNEGSSLVWLRNYFIHSCCTSSYINPHTQKFL